MRTPNPCARLRLHRAVSEDDKRFTLPVGRRNLDERGAPCKVDETVRGYRTGNLHDRVGRLHCSDPDPAGRYSNGWSAHRLRLTLNQCDGLRLGKSWAAEAKRADQPANRLHTERKCARLSTLSGWDGRIRRIAGSTST